MADLDPIQIENFDGGNAPSSGGIDFPGGNSQYAAPNPLAGGTGGMFVTPYTNVALLRTEFPIINATFRDFNDPPQVRFIEQDIRVVQQADTLDFLNLTSFFHYLFDFSEYQKQTFVINPRTTINLDPSSFSSTNGEISMLIARAYYLPEAVDPNNRLLFWDYKGNGRNPMGQFMVLSGAVKEGSSWYGWDIDPFDTYGHTGDANIANGGLSFTNPTELNVKLSIIVAS